MSTTTVRDIDSETFQRIKTLKPIVNRIKCKYFEVYSSKFEKKGYFYAIDLFGLDMPTTFLLKQTDLKGHYSIGYADIYLLLNRIDAAYAVYLTNYTAILNNLDRYENLPEYITQWAQKTLNTNIDKRNELDKQKDKTL
jgi:hypothetical protein